MERNKNYSYGRGAPLQIANTIIGKKKVDTNSLFFEYLPTSFPLSSLKYQTNNIIIITPYNTQRFIHENIEFNLT